MNLPNKLTSWREALPVLLRCLAIALAATLVGALAVSASWRAHRPLGQRSGFLDTFPGLRLGLRRRLGGDGHRPRRGRVAIRV